MFAATLYHFDPSKDVVGTVNHGAVPSVLYKSRSIREQFYNATADQHDGFSNTLTAVIRGDAPLPSTKECLCTCYGGNLHLCANSMWTI